MSYIIELSPRSRSWSPSTSPLSSTPPPSHKIFVLVPDSRESSPAPRSLSTLRSPSPTPSGSTLTLPPSLCPLSPLASSKKENEQVDLSNKENALLYTHLCHHLARRRHLAHHHHLARCHLLRAAHSNGPGAMTQTRRRRVRSAFISLQMMRSWRKKSSRLETSSGGWLSQSLQRPVSTTTTGIMSS